MRHSSLPSVWMQISTRSSSSAEVTKIRSFQMIGVAPPCRAKVPSKGCSRSGSIWLRCRSRWRYCRHVVRATGASFQQKPTKEYADKNGKCDTYPHGSWAPRGKGKGGTNSPRALFFRIVLRRWSSFEQSSRFPGSTDSSVPNSQLVPARSGRSLVTMIHRDTALALSKSIFFKGA